MRRPTPHDNPGPADPQDVRAAVAALAAEFPDMIERDVPLSGLTTFRIGGPALGLARIRTPEDALGFLKIARSRGVPVVCLGGGSNLLCDDRGFCGLVLKMEIDTWRVEDEVIVAGAGLPFDEIIARSLDAGLTGLEFASGIPGSLGGAIAGNAGCYGHEIGEFLVRARILTDSGEIRDIEPGAMDFRYRHSILKTGAGLLLEATLRLRRGDVDAARADRDEKIALRRTKHPIADPCAGSYFKNLDPASPGERRRAAGELLDRAGARSMRVGGASVFARHANIIINSGGATCADVLALAEMMKSAVREKFGVELTEEVRHLPWTGSDSIICG